MQLASPGALSLFEKSATVVTPTSLLAEAALEQFSESQTARGLETWQRPRAYGLTAWRAVCWQEARYSSGDVPTLLSPAQELALWQRIIEQEKTELFDVAAIARLAMAAANLLADWQIPLEGDLWNDHPDAQRFQQWFHTFKRICRERGFATRADVWRLLPDWLARGEVRPGLTAFTGFVRIHPALRKVQQALGDCAVNQPLTPESRPRLVIAKSFAGIREEIEFAARRARNLFERNPAESIGIFIPDLASQRGLVERTFTRVFYPSASLRLVAERETREGELPFHVDGGAMLADHPLIAGTLLLLRLARTRIDHAGAGAILRSPFIKGALAERSARALADLDLRKRRELDVSFADIVDSSRYCPLLKPVWKAVRKVVAEGGGERDLAGWSEFVGDLLAALGWPGDASLNEREQRIAASWNDRLSELAALGLVSPRVSFEGAISHLRRLLSVKAERANWSAPIQVLNAADAHGLQFHHAMALGLSEEMWPPAASLPPLVPLKLQRLHQVPGAAALSAREERLRLTNALLKTASETLVTHSGVICSIAKPLVTVAPVEVPHWNGRLPGESFLRAHLEQLEDSKAPGFVSTGETRGGASIIKAQSLCPFRAFAEYRLIARAPEDASFGFDARERGGFLHEALQIVWKRLETQERLRGTPPEELRALVKEAIVEAVDSSQPGPLHVLAAQAERERLEDLILEWLAIDSERKQPFTMEMVEEERVFEVPGLRLNLRIDRIDRLRNGRLVLIDYKSGQQKRPKLQGDRPQEPQLLVYAAAVGEQVDGIFFGQVKPRDVKAVGFSRDRIFKGQAAEVKKDWDGYMDRARWNMNKLAVDFVHGEAAVDPIKEACAFCGIAPLCRINEAGSVKDEEAE